MEHLREFHGLGAMRKKLVDSFSAEEQQKFNALRSEHQHEGFLSSVLSPVLPRLRARTISRLLKRASQTG